MKGILFRLAALMAVAAIVVPASLLAQTADELQKQIDDQNAQIAALNKEIEQYQKQLDATSEKKQTLQNVLSQLDISRKKITASINVTKKQIGSTQLQIQQLASGIKSKEGSISGYQASIAETLRGLNQAGGVPFAESLLSSESISAAWSDADAIAQLQIAVRADIERLAGEKESLTKTRTAAEQKREQLQKQQRTLVVQQGSLDATRKAQNELLAQTKSQESSYQTILRQKQAEKESFEAALFELASKLDYTLDPTRIPPAGKGILRWPLDNVFVTQQFGRTLSAKRLYTSGTHDGVDFRASLGTPVRASLSGTVTEVNHGAVQNCQYGKWVLVRHANGLATLYAHLSEINVSKGEPVVSGQVIGYSGNTGYATGPHLHFTVYLSEAISFKQYVCKSGRAVTVPIAPLNAYLNPLDYL
jgi:murein DD-endopeptidase MepM/ murein hydrolase activator NlpD